MDLNKLKEFWILEEKRVFMDGISHILTIGSHKSRCLGIMTALFVVI